MVSKTKWMHKHSRRRANERFEIALTSNDEQEIIRLIRGGKPATSKHLSTQSNTRTVWAVFYKDNWLPVVYDKSRGCLVTVLPKEALSQYGFAKP